VKISVVNLSYKRPKGVLTLEYLPFLRVYVDPSEEAEYRKANPGADIVACPKGIQGNVSRVRNYILREEFEQRGADVVLIVDDDLNGVYIWEKNQRVRLNADALMMFIEKYSRLAEEWGAKFWGVNVNQDKQVYRENTPFATLSFVGGPFQCFLKGNECFYDERLPLKEDYDMTLQQLNKYRIVMRINKAYYVAKQSEQTGGCAAYRTIEREREQMAALRKKWGGKIVAIDRNKRSHNLKKIKALVDYNPLIHAPISGV